MGTHLRVLSKSYPMNTNKEVEEGQKARKLCLLACLPSNIFQIKGGGGGEGAVIWGLSVYSDKCGKYIDPWCEPQQALYKKSGFWFITIRVSMGYAVHLITATYSIYWCLDDNYSDVVF